MPVRIYDISKKLGLENKEVLAKAKELGIAAARSPPVRWIRSPPNFSREQLVRLTPVESPPRPGRSPTPATPVVCRRRTSIAPSCTGRADRNARSSPPSSESETAHGGRCEPAGHLPHGSARAAPVAIAPECRRRASRTAESVPKAACHRRHRRPPGRSWATKSDSFNCRKSLVPSRRRSLDSVKLPARPPESRQDGICKAAEIFAECAVDRRRAIRQAAGLASPRRERVAPQGRPPRKAESAPAAPKLVLPADAQVIIHQAADRGARFGGATEAEAVSRSSRI